MTLNHPSIIWVEDDDNDILLFKRVFSKTSILNPLKIFKNAKSTIEYLEEISGNNDTDKLPALILLDIKLPGESGFKVLEWIRQQEQLSKTPIIILSSSKESSDIQQAYKLGANSYVYKPYSYNDLKKFIELIKEYWLSINQHPYFEEMQT